MGKVRIHAVKKVARDLVARYPDKFNKDFDANKKALVLLVEARTKRMRNRVIGYITRLKITEETRASAPEGEIVTEADQEG
ncbi:MAG TPA: 30S ribosomal protein S17e [Candidatus Binatus sp.]|nr:30S ribosomal protein S17e [Candidatus Binatus sp.]